jgi:hypothetical protein
MGFQSALGLTDDKIDLCCWVRGKTPLIPDGLLKCLQSEFMPRILDQLYLVAPKLTFKKETGSNFNPYPTHFAEEIRDRVEGILYVFNIPD